MFARTTWPSSLNKLISALPEDERDRLVQASECVRLTVDQVVARRNEPLRHVLFPLSGMTSLVIVMDDGSMVEIATVGREGVVGAATALGLGSSIADAIVPMESQALRIPAPSFRELLAGTRKLPQLVQRFSDVLFRLVVQNVACNRLHTTEERLTRWLLLSRDRIDCDQLAVTQEFLGEMLGVRRPSITEAVAHLEERGLIRHRRGHVTLVDRAALEASTCECYVLIRDAFGGLYA